MTSVTDILLLIFVSLQGPTGMTGAPGDTGPAGLPVCILLYNFFRLH